MRRSSYVIVILTLALLASNAYWFYTRLDAGVSHTYLEASYDAAQKTADQALAVLPVAARLDAGRAEIIAAASRADQGAEPFEKEGFTWVGHIGLKFGNDGRLVAVKPSIEVL